MKKQSKTTAQILIRLEDTLKTSKIGLQDLQTQYGDRKLAGLRNLVVFGRAVTNVLQNLRSTESDFDDWYRPIQEEMSSDPLMKFFYTLRSEILKEGKLNISETAYLQSFQMAKDITRFGPPPPGAKAFFIGDSMGGSGWEVELPDGTIEKYYVKIPGDLGKVELFFPEAPKTHLADKINDSTIEALASLYFKYLEQLVEKARRRFLD